MTGTLDLFTLAKIPFMVYITFMGPEIIFIPSAFKHGFSVANEVGALTSGGR